MLVVLTSVPLTSQFIELVNQQDTKALNLLVVQASELEESHQIDRKLPIDRARSEAFRPSSQSESDLKIG